MRPASIDSFEWRNVDDCSDKRYGPTSICLVDAMQIQTQRFGTVERPEDTTISFPGGIFGFELERSWVLLADSEDGSLYWLQSVEQTDLSFSVVDPREFVDDYALKVRPSQLAQLWRTDEPLIVLSVLTYYEEALILNLRNPILINPEMGAGRQVVASDDMPIRYELPAQIASLKKSA